MGKAVTEHPLLPPWHCRSLPEPCDITTGDFLCLTRAADLGEGLAQATVLKSGSQVRACTEAPAHARPLNAGLSHW